MFIEQDLTTKQASKGGLIGRLQARIKRADSREWKQVWEKPIKNKIVIAGRALVAYRIINDSGARFMCAGIGVGTTAATDSDTALESQILTRGNSTRTTDSTTTAGDTSKWVTSFTSDTTSYAVTEYGTFETATAAAMLNRVTFAAITLNKDDVLEFTYTCQIQEA